MKRGRKPIADRNDVRSLHITIKLSLHEREILAALIGAKGQTGAVSPGAYFRELMQRDLRRRKIT